MSARPQILYLVHRIPYPPNRGDRIRSFHWLKFLAEHADVHLAFLADQPVADETLQVLHEYCHRVTHARLGRQRWLCATASLIRGRTATEGLFHSRELTRTLRHWAQTTQYNLVVVYCSSMAQYLAVPELDGLPVLVDLVDVDSQKWFDYARQARGWKRWMFELEGRRMRRLESALPQRAAALMVVSEQEAALYRSFHQTEQIHAIPNGVDLEYFRPDEGGESPAAESCVFVGALDYRANVDGVEWFCREVWPGVRQRYPHAIFRLVGSNPVAAVQRLAGSPGVELVGNVADVRPYLREAAVAVIPLRVARGIQNKLLEALAMGKATIVTPQALEGVNACPGVHVCQAQTPEQWNESLTALFSSSAFRARLGQAGRRFVAEQFCWDRRFQALAALPVVKSGMMSSAVKTDSRLVRTCS